MNVFCNLNFYDMIHWVVIPTYKFNGYFAINKHGQCKINRKPSNWVFPPAG
jgi:hypothetical protein